MEKNKLPDSFCWAPYVNLDLDQDGHFYPCYRSKVRQGKWKENNVVEEYNNESMKSLRDDLWNGRENENCIQCHRREEEGVESTRQQLNKYFEEDIVDYKEVDRLTEIIIEDHLSSNISNIKTMEIRPHGMCTNACAHCDENSSTRWIQLQALDNKPFLKNYEDKPEVLTKLLAETTDLRTVHFTGGEPLLYPKTHINTLKQLPKNIQELRYHSSLKEQVNEKILEAWEEFEHVKIFVSLDTSEKFFSYFRFGSNWPTVIENIQHLQENSKVEIVGVVTVNVLTMLDFYPLIEYIIDNNFALNVAFVDPPHQLSCVYLPDNLKRNAVLQLHRAKIKAKEYKESWKTRRAIDNINKIQTFMFTHYTKDTWPESTLDFFAQLDHVYGLRIYDFDKRIYTGRHARKKDGTVEGHK